MAAETKVNVITTRKSNKEKIMDYFKDNPKRISTTELATETEIGFSNISRYLKQLEVEAKIKRETVQEGKKRFVYVKPTTRNNNSKAKIPDLKDVKPNNDVVITTHKEKQTTTRNNTSNNNALSISQKREHINPKFIEAMGQELRLFGTTIPIDKKQEIVNWVFKNVQHLYDGVYNYQRIWKTRYKNYLVNMPDSPVIEKFQSMSAALEFIKKIKILKEELENAKNGK